MRIALLSLVLWTTLSLAAGCDTESDPNTSHNTDETDTDGTDTNVRPPTYCDNLMPRLGNCSLDKVRTPVDLPTEQFEVISTFDSCDNLIASDQCASVEGLQCLVEGPSLIFIMSSPAALEAVSGGCNGFALPRAVDFASEKVMVYSHHMATCGGMGSSFRLYQTATGGVEVALFFWEPNDPFSDADSGCDSETYGSFGLIVPAASAPSACLYEHLPCLTFGPASDDNPFGEVLCDACTDAEDCAEALPCRSAFHSDYCEPEIVPNQTKCPETMPSFFDNCVDIGLECRYDYEGTFGYAILECTCEGWIVVEEAD